MFGFGLKALADSPAAHRWLLFTVAVVLFSRFLIGAAIHITAEHVNRAAQTKRLVFIRDVVFMGFYAFLGLRACHTDDLVESIAWMAGLVLCALIWAAVDRGSAPKQRGKEAPDYGFSVTNGVNLLVLVVACYFAWHNWGPKHEDRHTVLHPAVFWAPFIAATWLVALYDVRNVLERIGIKA